MAIDKYGNYVPKLQVVKPPLSRRISMESAELCEACGSTMMRRKYILFGKRPGCIHPKCDNYGKLSV